MRVVISALGAARLLTGSRIRRLALVIVVWHIVLMDHDETGYVCQEDVLRVQIRGGQLARGCVCRRTARNGRWGIARGRKDRRRYAIEVLLGSTCRPAQAWNSPLKSLSGNSGDERLLCFGPSDMRCIMEDL